MTTITAHDLCTGKRYECEILKETKCYYTVHVIGYYDNGSQLVERIHKNTLSVDYLHLSFRVTQKEVFHVEQLLASLKQKLSETKDKRMEIITALENDSHIGDLPKSLQKSKRLKLDGRIATLREIIFEIESS